MKQSEAKPLYLTRSHAKPHNSLLALSLRIWCKSLGGNDFGQNSWLDGRQEFRFSQILTFLRGIPASVFENRNARILNAKSILLFDRTMSGVRDG